MGDLISKKAVEKIIKEFFKTKIDEIPKRGKFNKLCDLCDLYLELNADLHKEIEDIPVAYDVDEVVERLEKLQLKSMKYLEFCAVDAYQKAIEIVKGGGQECQKVKL